LILGSTFVPCLFAVVHRADLALLDQSLRDIGPHRLANMEMFNARCLVDTIGFHLAVLDVRQNSAFHDRAVGQMLPAAGQ